MRRIPRSQQSIDALLASSRYSHPPRSSSPCLACNFRSTSLAKARHPSTRIARFSTSAQRQQPLFKPKDSDKSKSFTDGIQAKLWGGKENVLGREDPYDKDSPLRISAEQQAALDEEVKRGEIVETEEVSQDYLDEIRADSDFLADSQYEEAKTWHGLERVGGKKWVEEYQDRKRERRHFTKGYLPSTKITDPEALDAALHRAVAEVFTLHKVGMDLGLTSKGSSIKNELGFIPSVKVGPSTDGTSAILEFPDSTDQSTITEALEALVSNSQEDVVETESPLDKTDAQEAIDSDLEEAFTDTTDARTEVEEASSNLEAATSPRRWETGWQSISISDPDIKFAVVKRLMQLTGHRLSDPIIQGTNTVGELLTQITAPPKPKKLIEAIQRDGRLEEVSNVRISPRRVTPMDKEQEVGRWKVIEYALRERGLPVIRHS